MISRRATLPEALKQAELSYRRLDDGRRYMVFNSAGAIIFDGTPAEAWDWLKRIGSI